MELTLTVLSIEKTRHRFWRVKMNFRGSHHLVEFNAAGGSIGLVEASGTECIPTSSHSGDSLEEALWFFEACAWPACASDSADFSRLVITVVQPGVLKAARDHGRGVSRRWS